MQRLARKARRVARLDKSKIPPWQFGGNSFPHMTDEDLYESWERWNEHHIPLVSGGQLDQPSGWFETMDLITALYNTLLEQAYDEAERQQPPAQPGRRNPVKTAGRRARL